MMTNNRSLTKEDKDSLIVAMRDYHAEHMKKATTKKTYFFPKVPYAGPNGIKVIGLFRSELERMDEEVFIELINMKYEPLDEKRTLYRHRFNPHFREEYLPAPGSSERYSIPVHELEIVWKLSENQIKEPDVDIDSMEDCNFSQLTVRDIAALILRKPVSSKTWLNELIK